MNPTDILYEPSAEDILPITCFSHYCEPAAPPALVLAVVAIVALGGLVMTRWRDLLLVAAVALLAATAVQVVHVAWLTQAMPAFREMYFVRLAAFDEPHWWLGKLVLYALFLLVAAVTHGLKRSVIWVFHRSIRMT